MITYYRKTFCVMGAVLAGTVVAAILSNGWAESKIAASETAIVDARDRDEKASQEEVRLAQRSQQMEAVVRFRNEWKKYLPAGRDGELAMALRSSMEEEAQKKLGLVVDGVQTPAASQYALGRRNYKVQSVTMRASGSDLNKLLVWLGDVEQMYALARIEEWELTGGAQMPALKVTVLQPIVDLALARQEPKINFEVGAPETWLSYLPERVKGAHGINLGRNPLQPVAVKSSPMPLAPGRDEWSPRLQQALARKVRSVVRGPRPMVMIGDRMVRIGEEVVIGPKAEPLLPDVLVRLKEVTGEDLVFLVSSLRADNQFETTAKYKLEHLLIAK